VLRDFAPERDNAFRHDVQDAKFREPGLELIMAAKISTVFPVSENVGRMKASSTLAAMQAAEAMRAAGVDVVDLGAGEPDFDTPQHIKDAAAKALAEGFTKDTASAGIPELRQAIADKFKRENGLTYKPSQIIVSCGGKHSCYNIIMATCQEGDEVIIPAPYWLSYP
jgi:aspartate aminotransferase